MTIRYDWTNPDTMKHSRQAMGATCNQLADMLRLGPNGADRVRSWESGKTKVTGPVQVAMELLIEKHVDFLQRKIMAMQAHKPVTGGLRT